MLYGIDISNHNNKRIGTQLNAEHLFYTAEFIWMKATEGKDFIDKSVDTYSEMSRLNDKAVVGYYHYARPDLSEWHEEAKHFVDVVTELVREHDISRVLLALDWEGLALSYSAEWALDWLQYVEGCTFIKPLIYMSESVADSSEWEEVVKNGYGLWVASWNLTDKPNTGAWPFYAFHQYSDSPLDLDCFNGAYHQLIKYTGDINV